MFTKFKWHLCAKDFADYLNKMTANLYDTGERKLVKSWKNILQIMWKDTVTLMVYIPVNLKNIYFFHIETATTNIEIQSRPS